MSCYVTLLSSREMKTKRMYSFNYKTLKLFLGYLGDGRSDLNETNRCSQNSLYIIGIPNNNFRFRYKYNLICNHIGRLRPTIWRPLKIQNYKLICRLPLKLLKKGYRRPCVLSSVENIFSTPTSTST